MKIEHIALWVEDMDAFCDFYSRYFDAAVSAPYHNPRRNYTSRYLSLPGSEARIEVMHIPSVASPISRGDVKGLAHFAVSVGSAKVVDSLTERLRADGHVIAGEPRTTGDGYYESAVLDPEGNLVEITV